MDQSGPPLERLTHRLAETPPDFLDEPRIATTGTIVVSALVNDLLARLGQHADRALLDRFHGRNVRTDRNRLTLVAIMVWLLADEWFAQARIEKADVVHLLDETASELAEALAAQKYLSDPDRREELCRLMLARLRFRPQGESVAQATDRLSALSGIERKRLLAASRAAEARARAIREALIRKQAEESADKWSRE